MRRDRVLGKEGRRPDEEPLTLEAAAEVFLRERRALVRRPGLIAHQRELSGETSAPQRVDRLHGGLAASRDHDPLVHRRKNSPTAKPRPHREGARAAALRSRVVQSTVAAEGLPGAEPPNLPRFDAMARKLQNR